jgi:alpha-1,6-mannosyltransferase
VRIAQLANFVGPRSGGMKTALEALGAGYAAAGCERLLVIPGEVDRRYDGPHGPVVEVRAPRVGGGYRLILEPWRVVDVLEEWAPTSIECSDKLTLLPVARWARRAGVGSVLFSHERLDDQFALRTGMEPGAGLGKVSIGLLNRILVRAFDTVVVTSHYAQREFAGLAATAGTPMARVPLGVDLDHFRPVPRNGPQIRSGSGSQQVLRLIHVGRLSPEKSPQLAVATAVALHDAGVALTLDVYGEGPMLTELRTLAGAAPVRFHGHLGDRRLLARRIGEADIALSCCPAETFGLAVLEALACGTPVVTADVGGAQELVDAASGAWAEPEPDALADAVRRLARRPTAERRAAARARAEEFSWSATVDRMLQVHTTVGSGELPGLTTTA